MGERMDGGALRDIQKTAARETTLFPDPDLFVSHKKLSVSKSNIMRLEFLKNTLLVLLMWTEHRQSLLSF